MHGEQADWGAREELLATTVDQLQQVVCLLHAAWFKPPHPQPVRFPRPGGDGQRDGEPLELAELPRMSSKEEIRAFFGGPGGSIVVSDS
jgi:hypothetical protein